MAGFILGVIGNLVAAVLCGVPAYIHHHLTGKRRHAEVMAAIGGDGHDSCVSPEAP